MEINHLASQETDPAISCSRSMLATYLDHSYYWTSASVVYTHFVKYVKVQRPLAFNGIGTPVT